VRAPRASVHVLRGIGEERRIAASAEPAHLDVAMTCRAARLARSPALIALLLFSLLLGALPAEGEPARKTVRLGFLGSQSRGAPEAQPTLDALREGLRELGYVEGQNLVIEYRWADAKIERFAALANDLVRLHVDLIVAPTTPAARAAQQATRTIPIVAPVMGDPVADGLVASLTRPGGNVTGLTFLGPELVPKRLEIFKQALPGISRVAILWHPGVFAERTADEMMTAVEAAARTLKVELQRVAVTSPEELDAAFVTMAKGRADGVLVFPSTMLFNARRRIGELAVKHRLPSMSNAREFVELGGLIAYGASVTDLFRRGATYVDKILKGAKPADLPVEQPTKFELSINLKTAKALGVTIPQSVLLRADHVVE
jgi:putative ABC transport system substrate-binding protein